MRAQFLGGLVAATLAVAVVACTNPVVIAAIDKAVIKKGNRLDPAEGIAGQPINLILYQDPGQEWAEGQSATEQVWWGDNSSPSPVTFDGPGFTKSISHTYSKPGTYSVDIFQDLVVTTDKGAKLRKLLPIETLVATISAALATPTPSPTTKVATSTPEPIPAGATPTPTASATPVITATPTAAPTATPVPTPVPTPLNAGTAVFNAGRTLLVLSGLQNVNLTAIGGASRDQAYSDLVTGSAGLQFAISGVRGISGASGSALVSGAATMSIPATTGDYELLVVKAAVAVAVFNQQASGSYALSWNSDKNPASSLVLRANGGIGLLP